MKNPFKKLATVCVTAYANWTFKKAVKLAEAKRKKNYARQYVLSDPFPQNPDKLIVLNAKEFRKMKRFFHVPIGAIPSDTLINQSWYYTSGLKGEDAMVFDEQEIRRLAFVRMLLKRAKLADL